MHVCTVLILVSLFLLKGVCIFDTDKASVEITCASDTAYRRRRTLVGEATSSGGCSSSSSPSRDEEEKEGREMERESWLVKAVEPERRKRKEREKEGKMRRLVG